MLNYLQKRGDVWHSQQSSHTPQIHSSQSHLWTARFKGGFGLSLPGVTFLLCDSDFGHSQVQNPLRTDSIKWVLKLLLTCCESRKIKYRHLPVHKNPPSTELFALITVLSVLPALIVSLWHIGDQKRKFVREALQLVCGVLFFPWLKPNPFQRSVLSLLCQGSGRS